MPCRLDSLRLRLVPVFVPCALSLLLLLSASGCGLPRGYRPISDPENAGEHETVVIMGEQLTGGWFRPARITIDYQESFRTKDDLLHVRANIRNRTYGTLQVQIQTVFKNDDWDSVGEKEDWRLLRIAPGETQLYSATSRTPGPVRYTIRIRPFS